MVGLIEQLAVLGGTN